MDTSAVIQQVAMNAIERQQTVQAAVVRQEKQSQDALVSMLDASLQTAKSAPAPGTGLVVDEFA
ncbi:hypothetical protein [Methylobrevis pamukkalensis]|uniref:Motility protein n=1 Tax=Methylobrevis pamukkalensis TaxID=1439726 RepID=A0A1E3GX24_9HYPH|nr:hypothetical protein [Methylobrevis pamukkalensis]ODN68608.1 hypothetical protein A6302_04086 [Methylobrevis pamukkalensis]